MRVSANVFAFYCLLVGTDALLTGIPTRPIRTIALKNLSPGLSAATSQLPAPVRLQPLQLNAAQAKVCRSDPDNVPPAKRCLVALRNFFFAARRVIARAVVPLLVALVLVRTSSATISVSEAVSAVDPVKVECLLERPADSMPVQALRDSGDCTRVVLQRAARVAGDKAALAGERAADAARVVLVKANDLKGTLVEQSQTLGRAARNVKEPMDTLAIASIAMYGGGMLFHRMRQARKERGKLVSELGQLQSQLSLTGPELERLRDFLAAEREGRTQADRAAAEAEAKTSEAETETAEAKAETEAVRQQFEKRLAAKHESAQRKLKVQKARHAQLVEKHSAAEREIHQLVKIGEERVQALKAMMARVEDELKKQLSETKDEKAALEDEISEAEDDVQKLTSDYKQSLKALTEEKSRTAKLSERVSQLTDTLSEMESTRVRNQKKFDGQMNAAFDEKVQLQKRADEIKSALESAEQRLDKSGKEMDSVRQKLEAESNEKCELKKRLETLTHDAESYRKAAVKAEEARGELSHLVEKAEEQAKVERASTEAAAAELERMKTLYDEKCKKAAADRSAYAKAERASTEAAAAELERMKTLYDEKCKKAAADMSAYKKDMDKYCKSFKDQIDGMQKELSSALNGKKHAEARYHAALKVESDLQAQVQRAEKAAEEAELKLEAMRAEKAAEEADLKAEIARAKSAVQESQRTVERERARKGTAPKWLKPLGAQVPEELRPPRGVSDPGRLPVYTFSPKKSSERNTVMPYPPGASSSLPMRLTVRGLKEGVTPARLLLEFPEAIKVEALVSTETGRMSSAVLVFPPSETPILRRSESLGCSLEPVVKSMKPGPGTQRMVWTRKESRSDGGRVKTIVEKETMSP